MRTPSIALCCADGVFSPYLPYLNVRGEMASVGAVQLVTRHYDRVC